LHLLGGNPSMVHMHGSDLNFLFTRKQEVERFSVSFRQGCVKE